MDVLVRARALTKHEATHDWTPQTCIYGCKPSKLYYSNSALQKHEIAKHDDDFIDTRCPIPGCTAIRIFRNRRGLQEHVYTDKHSDVARVEADGYIRTTQGLHDADSDDCHHIASGESEVQET